MCALLAINCCGGRVRLCVHASSKPSFGGCVCLFRPFPLGFVPWEFRSQFPSPRNLCLSKRLGAPPRKPAEAVVMRACHARVQHPPGSSMFEQRSCDASYGQKPCLHREEAAEPSFVKTVQSTVLAAKQSGPCTDACRNARERRAVAQAKPVPKSSPRLAEAM